MMTFQHVLKRICMAFALRANALRSSSSSSITARLTHRSLLSLSSTNVKLSSVASASRTTVMRLFSSFQPGPPPGTHGTPVFPDIDFSVATDSTSESFVRNNDAGAVFVVTGASRGIGFEFVKSLINRTKGTIVAACREPEKANNLLAYRSTLDDPARIQVLQCDMEDQESIENAGNEIKERFDRVDLLLNVAGILGDAKTTPGPERSLAKMERDWLEKSLAVNLIGPVMLSKQLLPLIKQRRGPRSKTDEKVTLRRPVSIIANLSARVGSISDNELGGWYSYRMSKAALNQLTRTMAHEFKRYSAWCVSLHPGTTDTDLSKPFQRNVTKEKLFPVEFTVTKLLEVIDSMTEDHSGGFYDWGGKSISF